MAQLELRRTLIEVKNSLHIQDKLTKGGEKNNIKQIMIKVLPKPCKRTARKKRVEPGI